MAKAPSFQVGTQPGKRLPPGHERGPVQTFRDANRFILDPLSYLEAQRRKYGDVYMLKLLGQRSYMLGRPAYAQHVLQSNHRNYTKSAKFSEIRRVLGYGLLTSEGTFWLRQRRLAQPAFHRRRLAAMFREMELGTAAMLHRWETQRTEGGRFNLSLEMMRVALEIVSRTLFGAELPPEDSQAVYTSFTFVNEFANRRIRRPANPPMQLPLPAHRQFRHHLQVLDSIVYNIIEQRRKHGSQQHDDLLAMLMETTDADTGAQMNNRQLRDEVLTLFLAGHETSANALTWTFYLLAQHPQARQKLEQEVDRVLGTRSYPAPQDLQALPYARQVLSEAMRLYPPAWILARRSIEADEMGPWEILPRSEVAIPVYTIHRHPEWWEQPNAFRPERFTPEAAKQRPKFAYLPFGGGPRLCIGENFAWQEMLILLASIVKRYRLEHAPGHKVVPEPLVSLRPAYGMQMLAYRR